MIVVADASPLIFLAKIRRLELITELVTPTVLVPRAVVNEIMVPAVEPAERAALTAFLEHCRIEEVVRCTQFAKAMSAADNAVLSLAIRERAELLLCDERLTRTMAEAEGIRSLGTLGIMLKATRQGILSNAETRRLFDQLVSLHNFRIGVEVYQAVLAEMAKS